MLTFIAGIGWLSKKGSLPRNADCIAAVYAIWGLPIGCYSRVVASKREGRGKERGEEGRPRSKEERASV